MSDGAVVPAHSDANAGAVQVFRTFLSESGCSEGVNVMDSASSAELSPLRLVPSLSVPSSFGNERGQESPKFRSYSTSHDPTISLASTVTCADRDAHFEQADRRSPNDAAPHGASNGPGGPAPGSLRHSRAGGGPFRRAREYEPCAMLNGPSSSVEVALLRHVLAPSRKRRSDSLCRASSGKAASDTALRVLNPTKALAQQHMWHVNPHALAAQHLCLTYKKKVTRRNQLYAASPRALRGSSQKTACRTGASGNTGSDPFSLPRISTGLLARTPALVVLVCAVLGCLCWIVLLVGLAIAHDQIEMILTTNAAEVSARLAEPLDPDTHDIYNSTRTFLTVSTFTFRHHALDFTQRSWCIAVVQIFTFVWLGAVALSCRRAQFCGWGPGWTRAVQLHLLALLTAAIAWSFLESSNVSTYLREFTELARAEVSNEHLMPAVSTWLSGLILSAVLNTAILAVVALPAPPT